MKLYDAPIAPNPRRVRWVMAEKGITDIEVVAVSIPDGEHKTPDYLAKAGLPQLPMLEMDDGTAITESLAICRYLESRYPEPNLFGHEPAPPRPAPVLTPTLAPNPSPASAPAPTDAQTPAKP